MKPASIRSMAGCAQLNTAWNIRNRIDEQDQGAGNRVQQDGVDPAVSVSGRSGGLT